MTELLLERIQALEARLNDLCPPPNPSKVTPEGMPSFDVKKRIELIESQISVEQWNPNDIEHYGEIVVNECYISKQDGPKMFDKLYHKIWHMISLNKLTMISSNGTALDSNLSVLPDIARIRNTSVKEMRICAGFEFIPYLKNFPSLLRLEIVDHPLRPSINLNNEKKQKIREYCAENDIQLLCN